MENAKIKPGRKKLNMHKTTQMYHFLVPINDSEYLKNVMESRGYSSIAETLRQIIREHRQAGLAENK